MNDDSQLLRLYVEHRSEAAFTELVQRHLHLVYFSALRRVGGDAHLADDVTQRVFSDLARKAANLQHYSGLTGWLYTSTRFAAAQAVRTERRRKAHEQDAQVRDELHPLDEPPATDWDHLRPLIDAALDDLNERDREAVLLRYFENRSFAEVAEHFSLTPDAARMRVDRAVEKLRHALVQKGVVSTSAALAAAFAAQTAIATPAGLTQQVVGIAMSQTLTTAAAGTVTFLKVGTTAAAVVFGIGLAYVGVKHVGNQPHDAPTSPATAQATKTSLQDQRSASTASPDTAVSKTLSPNLSEAPNASPAAAHRTSDDFGWPRVGLFDADAKGPPTHTIPEFRAKMKTDSEFRDVVIVQAKENLDVLYGRLFRTLALGPAQLESFKNLLVEKERLHLEVVEVQGSDSTAGKRTRGVVRTEIEQAQRAVDAEIKTVLGDSGYVAYSGYREDLVQWTVINAVAQKLQGSNTPLTDYQTDRLLILLRNALVRIPQPYTFDLAYGAGIFPPHIGSAVSARVLKKASEFLSPPQLEALALLKRPPSGTSAEP
ncbi:MAG: sigma-70 family RNA polymerase sigma factor [Nibricoccus sp.]